jgi:putative spermidine/putrescine transport system ATP-binding protein
MSDRIAVFNEGLIEQVSTPFELYEQPATEFVAGFVGVSNVLERDGARFTIRPEKIQLVENGAEPSGIHTERGRVTEIAYAGMLTRYTIGLDGGGEVQLIRQNSESAADDDNSIQGKEVVVGWRPEHTVAVRDRSNNEEGSP